MLQFNFVGIIIPVLPAAHMTYIGFIYMDYTQNNSVVNTFVNLLRKTVKQSGVEQRTGRRLSDGGSSDDEPLLRKLEVLRWYLQPLQSTSLINSSG